MNYEYLSKYFWPEFLAMGQKFATERTILECIDRGQSPYQMIETICGMLREVNNNYATLLHKGPQPHIIVTTQDNFDKIKFDNEEYLNLHGSKENSYLKPRITSQEYFQLPEDKRRFYMRFCGHDEVYYTLNPLIK